jgi:transposase-like protein
MPEEQGRKRRAYDEAFKCDAAALMLKGERTVMRLAEDLGVSVES